MLTGSYSCSYCRRLPLSLCHFHKHRRPLPFLATWVRLNQVSWFINIDRSFWWAFRPLILMYYVLTWLFFPISWFKWFCRNFKHFWPEQLWTIVRVPHSPVLLVLLFAYVDFWSSYCVIHFFVIGSGIYILLSFSFLIWFF